MANCIINIALTVQHECTCNATELRQEYENLVDAYILHNKFARITWTLVNLCVCHHINLIHKICVNTDSG